MKYIKRIFLGLFSLVILIALGIFILVTFYKKEMAELITDQLKEKYALTLKIEDADVSFLSNWPQASVKLRDVYVESISDVHKNEPVLKAGTISLSFNLRKLLNKQFIVKSIGIKDAEILLIKHEDGTRNFDFKSQAKTPVDTAQSSLQFEINKVTIKNTHFRFMNKVKRQDLDLTLKEEIIRIKNAQDGMNLNINGDIFFTGLLFNEKKGAFLQNTDAKIDLSANVYFKSKMLIVYPGSHTIIDEQKYELNAFLQMSDSTKKLALRIESEQVDYEKGARLLTPKIQKVLSNFTVEKPFDVKTLVVANLDVKEDPILLVDIKVKDNAVKIGNSKIPYSKVSFKGSILSLDSTKLRGQSETATIHFKDIKGNLYDFPFTASVKIVNLDDPHIAIKARLNIEAEKIKDKIAQSFILKGKCLAKINYSGLTSKLNKNEFLSPAMRLNADLVFTNFSYQEANKPFIYKVNGKANVNNKDLSFDYLFLNTAAGDAVLKGKAEGFVNYVLGYNSKLKASLTAKTEYFNLNPFLPQKKDSLQLTEKKSSAPDKKIPQVDESDFEFNATFIAKKLLIRKVEAQNASVELLHKNKLLTIKSLNVNTCDGKLTAKGTIYDLSKIKAEIVMQDININKLFTDFENFGQKAVESKHLQGRVFVNATFKTDLDDNMEVIGKSMEGEVKLKLKDGHLLNFEPIQSVSDYIFRNRDFKDVTFTELNETFRIRGYEMEIEDLEIGSNVLNLYVKGNYNFREKSNINMVIPWHNLKRRGKDYTPKNYGETTTSAKGLKLNYSGPTNKMKLSLGHKEKEGS